MTKKELINKIKEEIKEISSIIKYNKKIFRANQSFASKDQLSEIKKLRLYPFDDGKALIAKYPSLYCEENGVFYHKYDNCTVNCGIASAKCRLTSLHIVYNMLRHKKIHCHSEERNAYYVQWNKASMERMSQYEEEKQDVVL